MLMRAAILCLAFVVVAHAESGKVVGVQDGDTLTVLGGEVTRLDKHGKPTELRPKIIFDKLDALSEKEQIPLPLEGFEDDEA